MSETIRDEDGNIIGPDEKLNGRALFREDGRKVCGAKRRGGREGRCLLAPAKGRNRCKNHSGTHKRGAEHHSYKDGRYSKYIPRGLDSEYNDARADENILDMREQYALLDARLRNVLKRSASGEAAALWRQIGKEWKAFKSAQSVGDIEGMTRQIDVLDDLIRRGSGEAMAWEEISRIIEQQRKLGESEQKRVVAMQQMVHKGQLKAVLGRMADIVTQHTTDPKLRSAIANEIRLTFLESGPDRIEPMEEEGRYLNG